MTVHKSGEDYLEAVLMIERSKGTVRSIDIVNLMGFSKPSVSIAMKNLCSSGYLVMDEDKHLHLTDAGREIAERIYERHRTLEDIFVFLGVDRAQAGKDACRVEHDLSDVCYRAIREKWLELQKSKEELRNEAGL